MKKLLLLSFILLIGYHSYSQFGDQRLINIDLWMAKSVHSADIDGDGDMDVISASYGDDKLDWYENLDGLGTFSSANFIAITTDGAFDVYAADIDGDEDMDIIHASLYWDNITWYKNTDGQGNYIPRFVTSGVSEYGVWSVFPGDIDGDYDLDLFYSYYYDDKIVWFENLNGQGEFGPQQIVDQNSTGPQSIKLKDLDNDGDLDLIAALFLEDKVVWYKNLDGLGNFSSPIIISTQVIEVNTVFAADLDGDNDIDVISASQGDNKISWFRNLDGQGNFSDEIIISTNSINAEYVHAEDLDMDGDLDVITAFDDSIAWHENLNGLGDFGLQQIISSEMESSTSVYTSDLDNDGDMDVLSSSWYDGKIAWYENLTILGVEDNLESRINIYPNPAKDILTIDNTSTTVISSINIYDVLGWLVLTEKGDVEQIDVSHLNSGLLFMEIETDQGVITKKIVKE